MGKRSRPGLRKKIKQRCKERDSQYGFMNYPTGTNFYKADEGEHNLLIIPYVIKTKKHPDVAKGKAKIGNDDYVLIVDIHRNVGPEDKEVICLERNFNKPCPLCEEGGETAKTSKRAVYNVINADRPEKGLYVLSVSDWLFQKELEEELKVASRGEEYLPFVDPEEGYIISFRGSKEYGGGMNYIKFKSFKFIKRDKELDKYYEKEKWEEHSLSLDEYMIIHSYEEIKNILENKEYDDENEDDRNEEIDNERDGVEQRRRERREKREEKNEKENDDECPYNYRFGMDTDTKDECDDNKKCPREKWKACDTKWKELNKK